MVVVGFSDDVIVVIPSYDGVRRDIQRAAQSDRVSFGDVTISQFRRKLESRSSHLGCIDLSALGQGSHGLPSRLRHSLG